MSAVAVNTSQVHIRLVAACPSLLIGFSEPPYLLLLAPAEASSHSNNHGLIFFYSQEIDKTSGSAQEPSPAPTYPVRAHITPYRKTSDASWARRTVRIACGFRWFRYDYRLRSVVEHCWRVFVNGRPRRNVSARCRKQ